MTRLFVPAVILLAGLCCIPAVAYVIMRRTDL